MQLVAKSSCRSVFFFLPLAVDATKPLNKSYRECVTDLRLVILIPHWWEAGEGKLKYQLAKW